MAETLRDVRATWKAEGFRGAVRRYGWKLIVVLFCVYLVRDLVIYLLLPYLIARQVMNG